MVNWLINVTGLQSTGDFTFILYITTCVIAVLLLTLTVRFLFGVFNIIFK